MPRLRRSDCNGPGIRRIGRGRGFSFEDAAGEPIDDGETLARIDALAIPPAWREVWISPDPWGHLQAVGIDDAGRRQYRYHDRWRARRDAEKFDHMVTFARALPTVRRRARRVLAAGEEPDRERVLAATVLLLDLGLFRIGSAEYAEENGSFGLTTLQRRHVRITAEAVIFDYAAKGAQHRLQQVTDRAVRSLLTTLRRRRGGHDLPLLAYRESRRWRPLDADAVNGYLKEIAGCDCSAKEFRTWNATVLAAIVLARSAAVDRRGRRDRAITAMYRTVADYLGNTPAVCRSSYVDPRVVDRFRAGETIPPQLAPLPTAADGAAVPEVAVSPRVERAVIELVEPRGTG